MKYLFCLSLFFSSFLLQGANADALRDLLGSYTALVEDQYEFALAHTQKFPEKEDTTHNRLGHLSMNRESCKTLKFIIDQYLNGEITPDNVLKVLLNTRFDYLARVKIKHQLMRNEKRSRGKISKFNALSTDAVAVDYFRDQAGHSEASIGDIYNYEMVVGNIDRYQIHNKLIVEIYRRHSLSDFTVKTKNLLSASVTLHPLLVGVSDDWSHPDAAILIYDEDPEHLKAGKDLSYFEQCIRERPFEITLKQWTSPHDKITIMSTAEGVGRSHLTLPHLGWLDLLKTKTVLQGAEIPSESSSDSMPEEEEKEETLKSPEEPSKPKFSEQSPKAEEELEEEGEADSSDTEDTLPPEMPTPEFPIALEEGVFVEVPTQDVPKVKDEGSFRKPPSSKKKWKVKERRERRVARHHRPYTAPPGLRKFHKHGFPKAEAMTETNLGGRNLKTLQAIFDPRAFQTVKYREFETLWEKVNGPHSIKKTGSGGSHRSLRNQKGDVVGSTFAHGGNHTYSARSIKYIRDALMNVGLGSAL